MKSELDGMLLRAPLAYRAWTCGPIAIFISNIIHVSLLSACLHDSHLVPESGGHLSGRDHVGQFRKVVHELG